MKKVTYEINGHTVNASSAWFMRNGRVAIILEVDRHGSSYPIGGIVHITSKRLGKYYWDEDGRSSATDHENDLVEPYHGNLIDFRERD